MVAIATETFVTSMQLYPNQPHLLTGTHSLTKKVTIGPSHMESPTGFSQASPPSNDVCPHFTIESLFLLLPHFFLIRTLQSASKR